MPEALPVSQGSSRPGLPRWVEAPLALAGLVALSPVLGMCALAVRFSSTGPVLFRQERVGRRGKSFILLKFRTMRVGNFGPEITAAGDSRITSVGRWLRRFKLDELPQLWNVVKGDMSIIGPRPEVPRYVDLAQPAWQEVLGVRPGITDPVTLSLRDEESLFARVSGDREQFYLESLLPRKLAGYREYLSVRTWRSDIRVMIWTAVALFGWQPKSSAHRDAPSGTDCWK